MEVNKIKEENNKKIEKYESLLNDEENKISELRLKEHELTIRYNKNNKEIKKYKKIINTICVSVIGILIIPVALQSVLAGLLIFLIYSGYLFIANKALKKINDKVNQIDNCTELDQTIISNEIYECEIFKKVVENSIFVRSVLNAIIDKQFVASSELETILNVFDDNNILHDFNIDEFNILNGYIKENNSKKEVMDGYLNLEYSNSKEKVKIKK